MSCKVPGKEEASMSVVLYSRVRARTGSLHSTPTALLHGRGASWCTAAYDVQSSRRSWQSLYLLWGLVHRWPSHKALPVGLNTGVLRSRSDLGSTLRGCTWWPLKSLHVAQQCSSGHLATSNATLSIPVSSASSAFQTFLKSPSGSNIMQCKS